MFVSVDFSIVNVEDQDDSPLTEEAVQVYNPESEGIKSETNPVEVHFRFHKSDMR